LPARRAFLQNAPPGWISINLLPTSVFQNSLLLFQKLIYLKLLAAGPTPNKRISAASGPCGPSSGFALRAQPNSTALKNASVFGALELRISAGVRRKAPLPASFNTSPFSARSPGARRASKYNIQNIQNKNAIAEKHTRYYGALGCTSHRRNNQFIGYDN